MESAVVLRLGRRLTPFSVNTLIGVPLTAYVDESMRRRRGESVCFYVLAAVIVDDDELSDFHSALRALLVGKAKSIHWRYEPPKRQAAIAAALAAVPLAAVVAVCLHGEAMPSERARRLSLGRLLRELKAEEVRRVVFDSRQDQDRSDYDLIRSWRRFDRPEANVRVEFFTGEVEPALWAPDCVAGAVAWWLNGDDVGWQHLETAIRVVDVEVP